MRCAVGCLVFVVGCFDPGVPPLRCSEAQPACPDGLTCKAGMCQSADSAGASDLSIPTDLSMGDMAKGPGCAKGGTPIGASGCWACPGVFSPANKPGNLCAAGFSIPSSLGAISDVDCTSIKGGFFASRQFGATSVFFGDPTFSQCGSWTMGNPGFFGCGSAASSGTVNPSAACNGFRQHLQSSSGFMVPNNTLDTVTSTTPTNGVICCG